MLATCKNFLKFKDSMRNLILLVLYQRDNSKTSSLWLVYSPRLSQTKTLWWAKYWRIMELNRTAQMIISYLNNNFRLWMPMLKDKNQLMKTKKSSKVSYMMKLTHYTIWRILKAVMMMRKDLYTQGKFKKHNQSS
jgi:hypothetical protein